MSWRINQLETHAHVYESLFQRRCGPLPLSPPPALRIVIDAIVVTGTPLALELADPPVPSSRPGCTAHFLSWLFSLHRPGVMTEFDMTYASFRFFSFSSELRVWKNVQKSNRKCGKIEQTQACSGTTSLPAIGIAQALHGVTCQSCHKLIRWISIANTLLLHDNCHATSA